MWVIAIAASSQVVPLVGLGSQAEAGLIALGGGGRLARERCGGRRLFVIHQSSVSTRGCKGEKIWQSSSSSWSWALTPSTWPLYLALPGSVRSVPAPNAGGQVLIARAVNAGLLSAPLCAGTPGTTKSFGRRWSAPAARNCPPILVARHSQGVLVPHGQQPRPAPIVDAGQPQIIRPYVMSMRGP